MALIAVAMPVIPGKEAGWQQFVDEINGPRKQQFEESRRRAGVHERTFAQQTPEGHTLVIVTLEGDDPLGGLAQLAQGDDEFTNWFVDQVQQAHGVDLRQPLPGPPPRQIAEAGG